MSPAAQQARQVILDSAPACIDTFDADSPRRTRAQHLLTMAQTNPPLARMAIQQLESYARTMHRNPPTPRTILGYLQWLTLTA